MRISLTLLISLLTILISHQAASCEDIVLSEAWVREPPPMAKVAAGYFITQNMSAQDTTIERVVSDCCTAIEMHRTVINNGHARMSHLDTVVIPANESISFEPGGAHLMLIEPNSAIRQGQNVELEFFCSDGKSLVAEFRVLANH